MVTLSGRKKEIFKEVTNLSRGLYKHNFKEIFGEENRIDIPVDYLDCGSFSSQNIVKSYLDELGYEITDYIGGYCMKQGDKNVYKIGKIIKDNTYVLNKFKECISRQKVKLVISRHPYDIGCASYDQDWGSCLDISKKSEESNELKNAIRSHTVLIAYLVSSSGGKFIKPLGRVFILAYTCCNTGLVWLYPASTPYGIFDKKYVTVLKDWLDENYNKKYVSPRIHGFNATFNFPYYLMYDNGDKSKITVVNPEYLTNRPFIRKQVNNGSIIATLKKLKCPFSEISKQYDISIILEEVKLYVDYHKLYNNVNKRIEELRCLLRYYGLSNEVIGVKIYLDFLLKHKINITRDKSIEDDILGLTTPKTRTTLSRIYSEVLSEKFYWGDVSRIIQSSIDTGDIVENGRAHKTLRDYFLKNK